MNSSQWLDRILNSFHGSEDVTHVCLSVCGKDAVIIFIDGMSDRNLLTESVVKPLLQLTDLQPPYYDSLMKKLPTVCPILKNEYEASLAAIASGDIVLRIDGSEEYIVFSLRNYNTRNIAEPPTASVLKGPREGFTEDLKINLTLVRRRIRSTQLVIKSQSVGEVTQTKLAVLYLDGVADINVVNCIIDRISKISTDGIIDSSYIAKHLERKPSSLFKQVGTTEKPDILTGKLLEGRIAVIVDGSPIALTVPFILMEDFQDSQDYFRKDSRASYVRILRLFGTIVSVFLPAFFVAVQEFQYHMLPLKFLLTIINATKGIPLTPTLEMIIVILIFDILTEASVRMPRYVGMALSIVGAIVLGETAVNAGLISSPAVLISALSSTGLFCVPEEVGTFSLYRLLFIAIAGVLGLYGLTIVILVGFCYLLNLSSYGSPMFAPFAPIIPNDLQDTMLKKNLMSMHNMPKYIDNKKDKRV